MRTRHSARSTYGTDSLAFIDEVPVLGADFAQMAVHRYESLTVIENNRVAVEEEIAGCGDDAILGCDNRLALGRGDVHSFVRGARLVIEEPA